MRFFITDICIPNTFKTVEQGINDTLYIRFDIYPQMITIFKTITITPKNYTGATLAIELEKLFNAAIDTYSTTIWDFKCLYELNTNTLTITGNLEQGRDLRMAWELYSDATLKNIKIGQVLHMIRIIYIVLMQIYKILKHSVLLIRIHLIFVIV